MKPQHRSILAIVLSIVVIIAWYVFFAPKKVPGQPVNASAATQAAAAESATPAAAEGKGIATSEADAAATQAAAATTPTATSSRDPQAGLETVESTIDTDAVHAVFTNKGGVPTTWQLKGYHQGTDVRTPFIDMAEAEKGVPPTMALRFEDASFFFPENPTYRLVSAQADAVVYEWKSQEVTVTKRIAVKSEKYTADVDVVVTNHTDQPLSARPVLTVNGSSLPPQKAGFFSFLKQPPATNSSPIYYLDGKVRRERKVDKIPAAQVIVPDPQKGGGLYWAGLEERYFLNAVIPRSISSGVSAVMGAAKTDDNGKPGWNLYAGSSLAPVSVVQNGSAEVKFTVYAGPKEINDLKAVGVHLDESIDYGWFTIIAMPILYLLKLFYAVVRNYGVAIILLTILIKLLLHPINIKSMKSMKAMQQLQPKLKELQAKFKNDKQRLNMETMQLFRAHKVNPMGGCLPMVLQFPVYIALYKVLWNSIELYHAPFFWFYRDLSAPDPYMITPILLGIGMVLQQKIMPSATADPAQKKMMMLMPIMFTVFMVFLPVGLVVYILINTAMSVTTQWMYNKGIRMRDVLRFKFKPART